MRGAAVEPKAIILDHTVSEKEAGTRLDLLLTSLLPGSSRRHAKRHIDEKLVTVNNVFARIGYLTKCGDRIVLSSLIEKARARPELAQKMGGALSFLTILFEDSELLVISKMRGMPSVTHDADDPLTVADCLAEYAPETISASPDPRESGLVHRLDTWTSGILIAAKNPSSWSALREGLFAESISKTYVALVEGEFLPVSGEVAWPLKQTRNGKRMEVVKNARSHELEEFGARTKIVRLKVVEASNGAQVSFVQCSIARARRHQVRAHLAITKHPLVGDELYGSTTRLADFQFRGIPSAELPREGFFLHAATVSFRHPVSGDLLEFEAESDFLGLLGVASAK